MVRRELSTQELGVFCEQLAMVLNVGITIEEGIRMMEEDLVESNYKEILQTIIEDLEKGESILQTFENVQVFPQYMMTMLKIGLESGKLDEVVSNLARYYEKEASMKSSIKRVVFYPLILLGIMATVILVITTQVIPIFNNTLQNLGMQMSGVAVSVMHIGNSVAQFALAVIAILFILGIYLVIISFFKGKTYVVNVLVRHSKLYKKLEVQRMLTSLAMMCVSGLEIGRAMELIKPLIQHKQLQEKLAQGIEQAEAGESMTHIFKGMDILSHLDLKILTLAGRTGCIDEVLTQLSNQYELEIQDDFERLLGRVEPTVIIILACVIGSILISVMFPLLGIMSTIG